MAATTTKTSCLPCQLIAKVFNNSGRVRLDNNNYIFTHGSSSSSSATAASSSLSSSSSRRSQSRHASSTTGVDAKAKSRTGSGVVLLSWWWNLAPTLAALLCYANSLQGGLVHDDLVAIVRNPDVRPDTPVAQVFEHDFWGRPLGHSASHKSYRPLTVLTFRLNYYFGELNPCGYHVTNVALHCLATLLFTVTCDDVIFRDRRLAGLAGLLFAVHPIHTEAVAGVVGRADILACVCFLLSFLAYHRCISHKMSTSRVRCWLWVFVSVALGTCAMLCKEQGTTVLGLCLLYDVFHQFNSKKKLRKDKHYDFIKRVSLVMTTLFGLVAWRVWMMGGRPPTFKQEDNPAAFCENRAIRVMSYVWVYACNLWQLLCPITLSYDWQMGSVPLVTSLLDWRNALSLLMISVLSALLGRIWRGTKSQVERRTFLGLAFLVLPFIPASNVFFTVGFTMAERVLYIPSTGFIILLVHGLQQARCRLRLAGVSPTAMLYTLALLWSGRTVARNQAWESRHTLFHSGLEALPSNAKMHYNYANLMRDGGHHQTAQHHYHQAIRLWPDYASAHNNLASLVNNHTVSEHHYRRAIAIEPRHAGAYFNLANLLHLQGRTVEAINHLETAIDIDPSFPDPYSSLGAILGLEGRLREAEKLHRKYVLLQPGQPDAHNRLGVFLANQGKAEEALGHYQKAISLDPRHYISLANAGRLLAGMNQTYQARHMFKTALAIDRSPGTLYSAGVFYFNVGETKRAAKLFKELLHQEPSHAEALVHYAQALAKMSKFHLAEDSLLQLLSQQPNHLDGLRELANVYGASKQYNKGIHTLDRILQLSDVEDVLAMTHFQMGNQYKDAGKPEPAFKHYKEAVKLKEDIGEAHHNLAVILHLNGSFPEALHHYIRARELLPENKLVLANLHKLQASLQATDFPPNPHPNPHHQASIHKHIGRITSPNSSLSQQSSPDSKGGFSGVRGSRSVSQGINRLPMDSPHIGGSLDPGRFVCDSEICQGDVKR